MNLCARCKANERIAGSSYCRDCKKQYDNDYYHANKDLDKRNAQQRAIYSRNRDFVTQYKIEHGCSDCEEDSPFKYNWVVLEFDHVTEDKNKEISRLVKGSSLEKIKLEINKCEVVCANHHRIRTFTRAGWL